MIQRAQLKVQTKAMTVSLLCVKTKHSLWLFPCLINSSLSHSPVELQIRNLVQMSHRIFQPWELIVYTAHIIHKSQHSDWERDQQQESGPTASLLMLEMETSGHMGWGVGESFFGVYKHFWIILYILCRKMFFINARGDIQRHLCALVLT